MTTENDIKITNVTVRLQDSDSLDYIGSGIIFYDVSLKDKVYVLTSSHCLFHDGDEFGNVRKEININIYNPKSLAYETLNHRINPNFLLTEIIKDVAVLVFDKISIENIVSEIPIIKVIDERDTYTNFIIKGFPKATLGEEIAVLNPTWLQNIDNRFQIELKEDYSEYNTQGFSGSGVFLIANNEVYLYGIFTRFRPEEKGKVIYCQYIKTVNKILDKNYFTKIPFSYFGNHGLTPDFFNKHIQSAIKDLGPRFNEDLNFQLPIAKIFNDIAKDNLFFKRFLNIVDKWVLEKGYRKLINNIHLDKIEFSQNELKLKVTDWVKNQKNSVTEKIELNWIFDSINKINEEIDVKTSELYKLQREEEGKKKDVKKDYSYRSPYEDEISRLREINQSNYEFIDAISNKVNVGLANNPYLIIKGDAGNGKSHLLGDIAKTRIEKNLPTLLLLGQHFVETKNIWENINSSLSISCTNKQLLETLNNIGKHIGSRVLLLIDAINEGAGANLWESQIAGFINEFNKYPFVGLVLTIRTTYLDFVIPDNVKNNPSITFKNHEGFKGNEYAALKLFCDFHDLKQPHFPILAPEFTKPLFLQLICTTIKDTPDKTFPQGFQGVSKIFEIYINSINLKFQKKREEYKYSNVVLEAIHKVALANYNNGNKSLLLKDVKLLLKEAFPDNKLLLNDLIEENIFITNPQRNYESNQTEEILYFAYQRFGDFYVADELLKRFKDRSEVLEVFKKENEFGNLLSDRNSYWYNDGILEAFSILLPEKFNLEIFEVYSWYFEIDEDKFHKHHVIGELNRFLLDSLNWRKIESIDDEKLIDWFKGEYFRVSTDDYFYKLTELSTVIGHPFNSHRMLRILKSYKMSQRDGFWQQHLRYYSGYNDDNTACPIRRLLDWAWTPEISSKLDFEITRLTAQTLAWVLSSTNRKLRDQTTKAMVNLLEQQPDALIQILKTFKNIDDLYISERLYAIAYGCILRTESNDSIIKIATFVYNSVFKKGNPPKHILLRDYARNTVEYGIYKNPALKVELNLIRPPYNSSMPEILPTEEDVKKYDLDISDKNFKRNYGRMSNMIHHSVMTWDFSRYTIDSAFRNFNSYSFTFEEKYKTYYKSLKKEQKKTVRALNLNLKTRFSYTNKENVYIHHLGQEKYDYYLKVLDECQEKLLDFAKKDFTSDEYDYIKNKLIQHFENKFQENKYYRNNLNLNLIKCWIVQRVFELGYDSKIHGEYDDGIERFNNRSENKIERIGKKYQWIALFEMLAMVSDNYLHYDDESYGKEKYKFYKGPWQMYIRDIDPAFTSKNKEEEEDLENDDLGLLDKSKEWWEDIDYTYWNQPNSEWVVNIEDLPKIEDVILKKDNSNVEWLYLKKYSTWEEPKPLGEDKYDVQRKQIHYLIQGYLIKKTDKSKIIKYLKNKNFFGRWMPESSDYNKLINREKFWSPAYLDNDKEIKWETIQNTNYKVILTTTRAVGEMSDDKSDAHFGYDMPCKTIFEGMNLQYAPIDGEFKNENGDLVVLDKNYSGVLIDKNELKKFLDKNNLDIFWTILGEKFSYSSRNNTNNYFKVPCGIVYFENDSLVGKLNSFDRD